MYRVGKCFSTHINITGLGTEHSNVPNDNYIHHL